MVERTTKALELYRSAIQTGNTIEELKASTRSWTMQFQREYRETWCELQRDLESVDKPKAPQLSPSPIPPRSMAPPGKRHRDGRSERRRVEEDSMEPPSKKQRRSENERRRSPSPCKGTQRKKAETQARGRAPARIEQLQRRAKYVKQYGKSPSHKAKVQEYKSELQNVRHEQCFFVDFDRGCRFNKPGEKTPSVCPFSHAPKLKVGNCNMQGTLKEWKVRGPQGMSFGFILLQDGNELFCTSRAFGQQTTPRKSIPQQQKLSHI